MAGLVKKGNGNKLSKAARKQARTGGQPKSIHTALSMVPGGVHKVIDRDGKVIG